MREVNMYSRNNVIVEHTKILQRRNDARIQQLVSDIPQSAGEIVVGRGKDEVTNSDKDGKSHMALHLYTEYQTYSNNFSVSPCIFQFNNG